MEIESEEFCSHNVLKWLDMWTLECGGYKNSLGCCFLFYWYGLSTKRLKCLTEIVVAHCSLIVLVEEYLWMLSLATMTAVQYKSLNIGLLSVFQCGL